MGSGAGIRAGSGDHLISKYEQSDWFSRFLVILSQQAHDFGRSVPDPFTLSRRRGLGTRLRPKQVALSALTSLLYLSVYIVLDVCIRLS